MLVLERGAQRRFYFLVPGTTVSFGRERGNDVILRAFQSNGELDASATNRVSRKHLVLSIDEKRATIQDDKSPFHTFVGPAGKSQQIPHGAPVELAPEFEIGFADTALRLRGAIARGSSGEIEAVRLARPDDSGAHHYICIRSRASVGPSEKEDAILVESVPAGLAALEVGAAGEILVRARARGVMVGSHELEPDATAPLASGTSLVLAKETILRVREARETDFLRPAGAR